MAEHIISEFDIIFLSYDEPNAEKNWADLLHKAPWAKRVHGVKGFDTAHKACAEKSSTERFITIDGDNIVKKEFFNQKIDVPSEQTQISWAGINALNGLAYGNGGPKLWTRDFVANMKTHENADSERAQTDFCWENNYIHDNTIWSTTYITETPFQAFKAGFREGVKMSLYYGEAVDNKEFLNKIPGLNLKRLQTWCSVGCHHQNGLWAIYGARLGCKLTNLTNWNRALISDYDWFKDFWDNDIKDINEEELKRATTTLGKELNLYLRLSLADLDENASRFFLELSKQ